MNFSARGKLLITGEYAVLQGAKALAVPTIQGQSLIALPSPNTVDLISYTAKNYDGSVWFSCKFHPDSLEIAGPPPPEEAAVFLKAMHWIQGRNHTILNSFRGFHIETMLDFPRNWGLGSSSTFVYLISQIFKVDAYALNRYLFGGSGYDIACASADQPLIFTVDHQNHVRVNPASFPLLHHPAICWVWQKRKAATRSAVQSAKKLQFSPENIRSINEMTVAVSTTTSIRQLADTLHNHELLISHCLGVPPLQEQFRDFNGVVKSLGAWGGDFFMAISTRHPEEGQHYFKSRGFPTVLASGSLFHKSDRR